VTGFPTPPIEPMLAAAVATLDDVPSDAVTWEPKLDGYRCLLWVEDGTASLWSRSGRTLERFFPELPGRLAAQLPSRCVLDGELVVPVDGRLDFDALSQRIHPAASRIAALAETMPAHLVVFDVLAVGDRAALARPWVERRALLESLVGAARAPLHLGQTSSDRQHAEAWLAAVGAGDVDGVVAKAVDGSYQPGVRGWWKVKPRHTLDAVVGGIRRHKDGRSIGSLLLGLHDERGSVHYVGASTALSRARRAEADERIEPLVLTPDAPHPWSDGSTARVPSGPSRWSGDRDPAWIPVQPQVVVEVSVERLLGGRLRHNASFVRWRDDRDATSCTFDQLPAPPATQQVWSPR
jgi:ATP-dependent DNA ligase